MNYLIKSHLARKASASSAQGSATVTHSLPSQSAGNSAGASTNLAEISQTLDNLLNKLSESERFSIGEENVANRLQRLCEKYPQSQVPTDLPEWQHDSDAFELARLAADCSEAVYERKKKTTVPGITRPSSDYEAVHEIAASVGGDFKATSIRIHQLSQTLVIAIRGTKKISPVDWITNANGEPVDAFSFLPGIPDIKAHSGFLYTAQGMVEEIKEALKCCDKSVQSVLFTGHSAGGAVATLLYLHLRLTGELDIPLHCITFAAPPTVSIPNITLLLHPLSEASNHERHPLFLAFVAHGDLVARADRPYILQILKVYSSSDASSPIPGFQFDPPELWNAGKLIILFDKNPHGDEEEIMAVEAGKGLGELLWGNVHVHEMKVYLELLAGVS